MFYTYVLQSKKNGNFYTGYTNDPVRNFLFRTGRLREHNEDKFGYTKGRGPYHLVYYEACLDEGDARSRELYLKTGKGKRYLKHRLKRFLFRTG
ncbi:MAG: GIY-YIG nuclease family protein [bacterium]|nr:GIY-YIG nuclease family protein [bacterium]